LTGVTRNSYVPARDGRRFLLNTPATQGAASDLLVLMNWAVTNSK